MPRAVGRKRPVWPWLVALVLVIIVIVVVLWAVNVI